MNKMMSMKIDLKKKSLGKNPDGTMKTIVQGVYEPIDTMTYRSKNNKSSSLLQNHTMHKNSKTIFDWKKYQMKKLNVPHFGELTLDPIDIDPSKPTNLNKNSCMTSSMECLPVGPDMRNVQSSMSTLAHNQDDLYNSEHGKIEIFSSKRNNNY